MTCASARAHESGLLLHPRILCLCAPLPPRARSSSYVYLVASFQCFMTSRHDCAHTSTHTTIQTSADLSTPSTSEACTCVRARVHASSVTTNDYTHSLTSTHLHCRLTPPLTTVCAHIFHKHSNSPHPILPSLQRHTTQSLAPPPAPALNPSHHPFSLVLLLSSSPPLLNLFAAGGQASLSNPI